MKDIFQEQTERNIRNMNADIDRYGMAFHIRDSDGNDFYFREIDHGFPVYYGDGGHKCISDLIGYTVIEKYATA